MKQIRDKLVNKDLAIIHHFFNSPKGVLIQIEEEILKVESDGDQHWKERQQTQTQMKQAIHSAGGNASFKDEVSKQVE